MSGSAAIVVVIGVALYATAGAGIGTRGLSADGLGHLFFFLFLFGWPIALVLASLIGDQGVRALQRSGRRFTLPLAIVSAGVSGAVTFPIVWAVFWGDSEGIIQLFLIGAMAGTVGGACFWLVAKTRA